MDMQRASGAAGGIDVGGTKTDARLFAPDGTELWVWRGPTPVASRDDFVAHLSSLVASLRAEGGDCPVGIGLPGYLDPRTGAIRSANLPLDGVKPAQHLPAGVALLNDVAALALGVGEGQGRTVALSLGTGVAAACVEDGRLPRPVSGAGGEVGHLPVPAPFAAAHGLPLLPCCCGRVGCYETLASGPGLTRWADARLGRPLPPPEALAALADDWLALVAELLAVIVQTWDPDRIVLAGGLSRWDRLPGAIDAPLRRALPEGIAAPPITVARDGPGLAARGAALHALRLAG